MKPFLFLSMILGPCCWCLPAQNADEGPPTPPEFLADSAHTSQSNSGQKVIAVADEASNYLIVSAPEGLMEQVSKLIEQQDISADNFTEIRLFSLQYADPTETADLLNEVFGDNSSIAANRQVTAASNTLTQSKSTDRLVAVPDPRTASVLVTAPAGLMNQAANLIATLDSSSAKKQKVFVYSIANADIETTETALKALFQTSGDSTGSSADTSTLTTRNEQLEQTSQNDSDSSSQEMP